ncbi:MAG: type II toxin-antitoxin system VapC family toxin [Candidatus Competibacteraceae bacterium]|nr:type II toxin-antitoxin system VapC family toxin [Candidatus Competibacteraceae bacterium]
MKCLLDTHAFLWAVFSPAKLSINAQSLIRDGESSLFLSTISFWEISLKYGMGKLELQGCSLEELPEVVSAMQLDLLHPSPEELASFHRLPRAAHKNPFDRLIIWQALQNKLHLVSKDQRLSEYQPLGLKVVW